MTLFARPVADERDGLLTFLAQQRDTLSAAVFGLTDEHARLAPAASALSLSVRWVLLHLIKEIARHAGHADIIRESLDGQGAGPLNRAFESDRDRRA